MASSSEAIDWASLRALRARFLEGGPPGPDYWSNARLLADYDATFGARIGWKWSYVLSELGRLGWTPPPGELVDWGCGTGVAARAVLESGAPFERVRLWDRSAQALDFAAARIASEHPGIGVEIERSSAGNARGGTLLVSHVLSEISPQTRGALVERARRADAVIWVEPGTFTASRALIDAREQLRGELHPIAPCPHDERCGLLDATHERDWCHQFVPPPTVAFTEAGWARFGKEMGIDLRSLPVSFLVLDRRASKPLPSGATRLLGRPRVQKGMATLTGCSEPGVRDLRLRRSVLPGQFREAQHGDFPGLAAWRAEGTELVAIQPIEREDFGPPQP